MNFLLQLDKFYAIPSAGDDNDDMSLDILIIFL